MCLELQSSSTEARHAAEVPNASSPASSVLTYAVQLHTIEQQQQQLTVRVMTMMLLQEQAVLSLLPPSQLLRSTFLYPNQTCPCNSSTLHPQACLQQHNLLP